MSANKIFILKSLSAFIVITIFAFLVFSVFWTHKIYTNIFRLSSDQISSSLLGVISQCKKINDCKLLPGDILIRRYITSRTWVFDRFVRPYFTHSAFYIGNDQIIEAVGKEKSPIHDIQIVALSTSDWFDPGIESWVVIIPKKIAKNFVVPYPICLFC